HLYLHSFPTRRSSDLFVVLTQPVKVKIAYGETILPAGMKLPVVSSDAASVRVKYMGEVQTIPLAAARFETSEPPDAAPSTTAPTDRKSTRLNSSHVAI